MGLLAPKIDHQYLFACIIGSVESFSVLSGKGKGGHFIAGK
jgi:hypothetical protein